MLLWKFVISVLVITRLQVSNVVVAGGNASDDEICVLGGGGGCSKQPLHLFYRVDVRGVQPWTYYKWTVYDLSFFDHDDRHRHLAVRILMTTSKWLDNDDYVIM